MNTYILLVTTKVVVKSELSAIEAADEFQQETNYSFTSTDKVKVVETELIDTINCYI